MRTLHAAALTATLISIGTNARASTFDDATGTLSLDRTALLAASLDSSDGLGGMPAVVLEVQQGQGYSVFAPSKDNPNYISEGIEGKGALRIPGNRAVLLGDEGSLAALSNQRVEITLFARADGALPELRAIYSRAPLDVTETAYPLARVIAFRTGRATSDGWVELSTGPIDSQLTPTGVLRGILLTSTLPGPRDGGWNADALEIHAVSGPLAGNDAACTLANEAAICGKGGACIEGLCLDAAITYGPLLPVETRQDIVARMVYEMTRFQEDRHATANALAGFAKDMPAIATNADTPLAFYRPLATMFGAARGAHSFAPAPDANARASAGNAVNIRFFGTELNACFGLVEKDLSGGGRGYGVYQAISPTSLVVGDVVTSIDGEPADTWLARLTAEVGLLAADSDSDRANVASSVSALVMRYGHTLVVDRCAASGCGPVTIDLLALRSKVATVAMTCSPRFQRAVDVPKGVDPDAYETAIAESKGGIMSVQTNGEPLDDDTWVSTVSGAFDSGLPLVIDKRRGDGGGGSALQTWSSYLRPTMNTGIFFVSRVDHAAIDGAPGILDQVLSCDGISTNGRCELAQLQAYAPKAGALQKTAWLNVLDGSASDMATYYAKGAANVRIFAPNRTMGLFGSLGVLGGFLPTWTGGSVQITDTRAGNTAAERESGAFRTGTGIEPDEVVVQLQSDLLSNKDTMLARAREWVTR